jgi:hypothetical protein
MKWFFIKQCDKATNSLNGSANTGNVAEDLTTALGLQKHSVSDLSQQATQTVQTFKMTRVGVPDK